MAIKKYKPTTPGRRGMTVTDYSVLSKVEPERSLLESKNKHAGRNNTGKITVRHRGGGNRVKYRVIDFKRNKFDVPATVKTLEYDPNRSAFIALIEYEDGVKSYILAPDGLKVGDAVMAGPNADIKPGNALPFENIPVGTMIHNIELYPGKGGQLVRSAGNSAQLMAKGGKYATLRMPSGEMRMVPINCRATVGVVGNGYEVLETLKKHKVDIILMDIRMPKMDGVYCTKVVKEQYPEIKIVILTTFDDDEYIFSALKYGASGYLLKDVGMEELYEDIMVIYNGGALINPDIATKVVSMFSNMSRNRNLIINVEENCLDELSKNEWKIVQNIGLGLSNKLLKKCFYLKVQSEII